MARVHTYLNFSGETEAALTFYADVFNSRIENIMRWGDMPLGEGDSEVPEQTKRLVMNAQMFILGGHSLMASDVPEDFPETFSPGNNVTIVLEPDTRTEADRLFAALSSGGEVRMPMAEMFWGDYYGEITDKFGVQWMIDTPAKE